MTTPETPEPLTFCPDCGSSSPAQHFTHCPHYEKSGPEPTDEPELVSYGGHTPTFTEYTAGPSAGWTKRWRYDCSCGIWADGFPTRIAATHGHTRHADEFEILERSTSARAPIGYAPTAPGFTQRQLPELMREQARWVKSMPPTAASLLERAAIELEEASRIRRLHEEATRNAAAYRTALERIIERWDASFADGNLDPVETVVSEARKLLEGKAS